MLAAYAVEDGTCAQGGTPQRRPATRARLPLASVHLEFEAEVTRLPIGTAEVAQCGSTPLDGSSENLLEGDYETLAALARDPSRGAIRPHAREERRFVGVDVADSGHDSTIDEKVADGHTSAPGPRVEVGAMELLFEGLGTQIREQSMAMGVDASPQERSEAARVAKPQRLPAGDYDVHMVMFLRRLIGWYDAQTSGHAEVHDGRALCGAQ